jgi:hypothetical protein
VDSQLRRSVAHASAVLSELQDGPSLLSAMVPERSNSCRANDRVLVPARDGGSAAQENAAIMET